MDNRQELSAATFTIKRKSNRSYIDQGYGQELQCKQSDGKVEELAGPNVTDTNLLNPNLKIDPWDRTQHEHKQR